MDRAAVPRVAHQRLAPPLRVVGMARRPEPATVCSPLATARRPPLVRPATAAPTPRLPPPTAMCPPWPPWRAATTASHPRVGAWVAAAGRRRRYRGEGCRCSWATTSCRPRRARCQPSGCPAHHGQLRHTCRRGYRQRRVRRRHHPRRHPSLTGRRRPTTLRGRPHCRQRGAPHRCRWPPPRLPLPTQQWACHSQRTAAARKTGQALTCGQGRRAQVCPPPPLSPELQELPPRTPAAGAAPAAIVAAAVVAAAGGAGALVVIAVLVASAAAAAATQRRPQEGGVGAALAHPPDVAWPRATGMAPAAADTSRP